MAAESNVTARTAAIVLAPTNATLVGCIVPARTNRRNASSDFHSCARRRIRTVEDMRFTGIDPEELSTVLGRGTDHGGHPVQPFVDDDGGWPLRCCLTDSRPGDRVAIIAWSPMPWPGAYAETGPVVVHADGCTAPRPLDRLPDEFDARAMTLRPYGRDRRIAYHRVVHVASGGSVTDRVAEVLSHDDVDFVHGRNVTGGCYAFTATRSD